MSNTMSPPHLSMRLLNEPLALWDRFAAAPQPFAPSPAAGLIENIAIIPICGVLVHGAGDPDWGLLGYDDIADCFGEAIEDDSVAGIVLLVNSPGGHVAGMFDLADMIFAGREAKPIVAALDEVAYSAAYLLASAAHVVTVPATGGTGSIGCACIHTDISEMLKACGITPTVVRSAPRKFEGNQIEPLTDDARAGIQAEIDMMAGMFVERVARFRQGKVTAAQIEAAAGRTFPGATGVQAGLADSVMSAQDAVTGLWNALFQ